MEIRVTVMLWFIIQELILELERFYFEIMLKTKLFSEIRMFEITLQESSGISNYST